MKNKTLLVAQRELVENVRTKAFWIGILLFPVLITVMMVAPSLLDRAKSARPYAVIDNSGWLLEEVDQRAALPDLEKVFRQALERKRSGSDRFEELPQALREATNQIEVGLEMVRNQAGDGWDDAQSAENESKIIEGFASVVAGFAGTQGGQLREMLPPAAVAPLEALREEVRQWWQALPAEEAAEYASGASKSRYLRQSVPQVETGADVEEELKRQLADGDLFAYIVIGEDPVNDPEGHRYVSSNLTDNDLQVWFSRLASDVLRAKRLDEKQIDAATADWIQQPFDLRQVRIGEGGAAEDVGDQDRIRQWAPVAFVYLLWISVMVVAQMLLTNTVEEKSNKLMEVLLSSVSPLQLMIGKIVGIAATGLAMLGSWAVFFYLATKLVPLVFDIDAGLDLSIIVTDPKYMASFFVYFVLGYLFYASLLVGIGSVCDSLKEAQNLMTPVMLLMFVPLASMMLIGQDPNGLLARVMSYIPPFTPFVMMNRAAGPPPTWEYVATTVLLVVAVAAVMWAAAKVFRVGVLMTGKPPKVRDILRLIRAPVGVVPERKES